MMDIWSLKKKLNSFNDEQSKVVNMQIKSTLIRIFFFNLQNF